MRAVRNWHFINFKSKKSVILFVPSFLPKAAVKEKLLMRPLYNHVLMLILSIFLTHTHAHGLPLYSLTLTPESGKLILKPDNTSGWGYRITNNSDHFVVPLSIDADIVFDGILFPLFDFPVIAPHSFLEQSYIHGEAGLFEFAWNPDAFLTTTNTGHFSIIADFFTNDPLLGGIYVMHAGQALANYSIEFDNAQMVSEPQTIFLLVPILLIIICRRRTLRNGAQRTDSLHFPPPM